MPGAAIVWQRYNLTADDPHNSAETGKAGDYQFVLLYNTHQKIV